MHAHIINILCLYKLYAESYRREGGGVAYIYVVENVLFQLLKSTFNKTILISS